MIGEYLILAAILAWAVYYLWRTFTRKRGCSCTGCPLADSSRRVPPEESLCKVFCPAGHDTDDGQT